MPEILEVNIPGYWNASVRPRGYKEIVDAYDTQGRITGIWELVQWNNKTGDVIKRVISRNVVTDQGAVNVLQRATNSSSATLPNLFNNILITNNSASTTLTTALTANATNITSLAVAALPAALPANTGGVATTLKIGYGGSNPQTVTLNGAVAQGATSITVQSFTVNSTGFGVGAAVVPNPHVAENPNNAGLTANATTPLSSYSGNLSTGAFTYNATTGPGNRNVVVTFTFTSAGGTSTGNYTDAWLVNASSGATTNGYIAHEINTPMRCDVTNNVTATITISI